MPDLDVRQSVTVEGPRGGTYTLGHPNQQTYTCSCASYQTLRGRVGPYGGTCRHLIEYRGTSAEAARVYSMGLTLPQREALLNSLPTRLRNEMATLLVPSRETSPTPTGPIRWVHHVSAADPVPVEYVYVMTSQLSDPVVKPNPTPLKTAWERLLDGD